MSRPAGMTVIILLLILLSGIATAQEEPPTVRIGAVIDGPWERNAEIGRLFQDEISSLLEGEFKPVFADEDWIVDSWSAAGVRAAIDSLLADPEVDIVLGLGAIVSDDMVRRRNLPKPVIAPFVGHHHTIALPLKGAGSGVTNLSYLNAPWDYLIDIQTFREVIPFDRLVILGGRPYFEAMTDAKMRTVDTLRALGIDAQVIVVGDDVDAALSAIPDDCQAVYIGGMLYLSEDQLDRLIAGVNKRKLPSFALFGRTYVRRGVLAGLAPETDFGRIARRVALYVQRLLLGDKAADLPVSLVAERRLSVNMATAREIGVTPSWEVLTEAELLNPLRSEVARTLSLTSTIREALQANLALAAEEREVAASRQNIGKARSNLLPQVNLSARAVIIDKDRAENPFAGQAERTFSGSAAVSQSIFSEPAWANLSIQQDLQRSREQDYNQHRLDIIQQAATAYLDVLRALTAERIQRDNVRRTRANLELARQRLAIGSSGRSDVLRWENQIASDRISVIDANASRNLAEIELNRMLNRPLEEPFATVETSLTDSALLVGSGRLFAYMSNPQAFRLLRTCLAEQAVAAAPEIQSLDAAIAARKRSLSSSTRSFFTPSIAARYELTNIFSRGGAGSEPADLSGLPPGLSFERPDDVNWQLGVSASFPLFSGGNRFATRKQDHETLSALRLRRRALADRIEQRVRSALHIAGASYARIRLSRDASRAAGDNLDLVVDAYSRGAVSIIELIDAQYAFLVADQRSAAAVYDFLVDELEVERSIGRYDLFRTDDEREEFYHQINRFFEQNNTPVPQP